MEEARTQKRCCLVKCLMETRRMVGWAAVVTGVAILMVSAGSLFFVALALWSAAAFLLTCNVCRSSKVDPNGRAVFITGCDSGFGQGLALRLDALGYTVFAGCLAPDREGAKYLKDNCSPRLQTVPIDVTDDWQVRQAVNIVKEHIGDQGLWALVNNAGVAVFTEIEWCSVLQYQRVMDVNVLGVVRVTKAFLPLIRQAKGRVVNVASLAGRFTLPAFSAYSMSKKACIAFSDGLRQEMAKFDIKVVTIEPGLYRTPISSEDYLINMNRKSWAETPKEVKKDYGDEYFDAFLKNITDQMRRARPNVNEVVDLMVEAVCASNPQHRYVPYWASNVRATILTYLPAPITDRLFRAYGPKVQVDAKRRVSDKERERTISNGNRSSGDSPVFS